MHVNNLLNKFSILRIFYENIITIYKKCINIFLIFLIYAKDLSSKTCLNVS